MLKIAFQMGMKRAYDEANDLTPQQMQAAQRLSGIGGALTGATGGSLLGKYLGGQAAEAFSDKGLLGGVPQQKIDRGKLIGALLGGAGGGAIGGYAGAQVPKWLKRETPRGHGSAGAPLAEQPLADQSESESALELLPRMYGLTPDSRMYGDSGMENFYPEY